MLKIIILVIGALIALLCLSQESKNDGVMSLTGNDDLSLFKKKKEMGNQRILEIATAVLIVILFVCMTIYQITA